MRVLTLFLVAAVGSSTLVALPGRASAQTEAPWTVVRTGQMVGTETTEGQPPSRFFMAGECSEARDRRSLRCHFNSAAIYKAKPEAKCTLLASAWVEHLRLVNRTPTEVVWATTTTAKSPEGVTALTTTTLKVQIEDTTSRMPPSFKDQWEHVSRTTYSTTKPPADASEPLKPRISRALKPGAPGAPDWLQPAECLPESVVVDARQ